MSDLPLYYKGFIKSRNITVLTQLTVLGKLRGTPYKLIMGSTKCYCLKKNGKRATYVANVAKWERTTDITIEI